MKKEKIAPLECVKTLSESYPDIWDSISDNNLISLQKVNDYCNDKDIRSSTYFVYGLACWRKNKQVYEFDRELAYLLKDINSEDDQIPVEILDRMPYETFYIKLPKDFLTISKIRNVQGEFTDLHIDGVLIFKSLQKDGSIWLNFQMIFEDYRSFNFPIAFEKGLTINQACKKVFDNKCSQGVIECADYFLQCVLYLCADNAEIEENVAQKEIYKPAEKESKPKDSFREIRKWEVGYRYGSTVRKNKRKHTTTSDTEHSRKGVGSGTKKRPHSRKGHWHNFWVGSEKQGNRRLVLHWVAPTIINADYDSLATAHKVK